MKPLLLLLAFLPVLLLAQNNTNKITAHSWIEQHRQQLIAWSDSIWTYAEPSLKEYKSARLLINILKQEGFTVQEKVCGFESMFIATYGTGKPVIGLYGEY